MTTASWKVEDAIAESLDVPLVVCCNVVKLLEDGATIPFIARYRKEMTDGMEVDKLRDVNNLLDELKTVQAKICSVVSAIDKLGKMTKPLEMSLKGARTLHEVELLYAPFKPGHKGSLAERAKRLGLEAPALQILKGQGVCLKDYIKPGEQGISKESEVELGIQHIIADIISKDKETMDEVRSLCKNSNVTLESCQSRVTVKKSAEEETKSKKPDQTYKFEQYFDFRIPVKYVKSHQILALNRGEEQKILSVKIVIPDFVKHRFTSFVTRKRMLPWFPEQAKSLLHKSIADAYDRLIQPQMCRHIRSELTKTAEKASVSVFASNLKRLLLMPPVKGKTVLGIDPGFKNGCKSAVISSTGHIIDTVVLYLHDYRSNKQQQKQILIDLVKKHGCEIIAIGNGVACRETETFVGDLIQQKKFSPQNVVYCIVDESGASIYSVSDEAKKELPDLDPTLRGAVSIARRLLDPLAEFVKIEPKHIGVGMYQHDIAENKLKTSLDSVVEECVSFVGVDLNTGSECLLRRIAGLSSTRAKKIIEWREKNGAFITRDQLLSIKGLGQKSFEQCAGFVRVLHNFSNPDLRQEVDNTSVMPEQSTIKGRGKKRKIATTKTAAKKRKIETLAPNPLDMTSVHPESYHIANRLIEDIGVAAVDIGQSDFISRVKKYVDFTGLEKLADQFDTGVPTMKLITDALSQPVSHDIRDGFDKPLFKKGVTAMDSLQLHQKLTGRVTNVTHFGAFVDIGVGQNGLIHVSKMRPGLQGRENLQLGDHVEVQILSVDVQKQRVGLQLLKLVSS